MVSEINSYFYPRQPDMPRMRGRKIPESVGNAMLMHMVLLLPQSKEKNGEIVVKIHETLLSI